MQRILSIVPLIVLALLFAGCGREQPASFSIDIASKPEGAAIYLDGKPLGQAPLTLSLPAGARAILRAEAPGCEPVWQGLVADAPKSLLLEPAPARAPVLLTSAPSGAEIYLDNKLLGQTPKVLTDLPAGSYHILLRKPGFADKAVSFSVDSSRPRGFDTQFVSNLGKITVNSIPAGAGVAIDGNPVGITPYTAELSEGVYKLTLSREGFADHVETLTLSSRENLVRDIELNSHPGRLELTSEPSEASVYLNGEARGITPLTLANLAPGTYRLELSKDGYAMEATEVKIEPGRTTTLKGSLVLATGGFDIVVEPAGVEVFIDGRSLGESDGVTAFRERNLDPGVHVLRTSHRRADPEVQEFSIEVRRGEVQSLRTLKIWVANAELVLRRTGERMRGYVEEETPGGRLWYSPGPGLRMVFPREDIESIHWYEEE